MKKICGLLLALVMGCGTAFAADPFDAFRDQLTSIGTEAAQKTLDSFAKDLGSVMGGGAVHQGKALGIPGFDIGIRVPSKKVGGDNAIVKGAGVDTLIFPVAQVEIGLPGKFDLLGRFTSYSGATMIGAGVRYGIFKNSLPVMPSLSVQATYNMLDVATGLNKFKATTTSLAAVASFNLPVVDPYLCAGLDSTSVEPDATIPLPQAGMKGSASGYRLEGGINMSLIPFTYLQLGAGLVNGDIGYTAGLGVKF